MKTKRLFMLVGLSCLWMALTMLPTMVGAQNENTQPQSSTPTALEHEAGLYYTVKKGDTLWSISKHFNDSPYLWPELWKENDQIANPHWIYPGEKILLYHKSGVTQITKKPEPIESPAPIVAAAEPEEIKIPEPTTMPEAPPQEEEKGKYYFFSKIEQVGFLKNPPIEPFGSIFQAKDAQAMISESNIVYIHPHADNLALLTPGSLFTLYRTPQVYKDKDTDETIGTQHYLTGVVEIQNRQADYAIAIVRKSYKEIRIGDQLMPYAPRSPKIRIKPSNPDLHGEVIASEENSFIMGDDNIAFINRGTQNGVAKGQFYAVYYQEASRIKLKGKKDVLLAPVNYAKLLVLHAEKNNATVLITNSDRTIRAGATLHAPSD